MYRKIKTELLKVPNSNHVTEVVCNKFSGFLQIDAKYVSVKGHQNKMAFIWSIDYYTHDIIWNMLVPSESAYAYLTLFKRLKALNYPLKALICDEHTSILSTVNKVFPNSPVQICLTHYKRNIRYKLNFKQDCDLHFWQDLKLLLSSNSIKQFSYRGRNMLQSYMKFPHLLAILADIQAKEPYLTTNIRFKKCPDTTNLIECYNKHLNVRLKKLDGFKSYDNAQLWLNAYIWLKRTSKLKCCKGKFRKLNGHMPLAFTAKDHLERIYNFN